MSKNTHPRVLIVSSSIDRGGLGNYLLTLTDILKSAGYTPCFLLTHGCGELYGSLKNLARDIYVCRIKYAVVKYFCILKEIWRQHPDMIINNYNAPVQYLAPFLPLGTKVVHILHSDDRRFYRIAAINAWRVNAWVAPSPAVAANFKAYMEGEGQERVRIIPHGTRIGAITKKEFSAIIELIFVGALYEHKGVCLLPKICNRLSECGIVFHMTIVGNGPARKNLEESFGKTRQFVSFIGEIETAELEEYWSRSDILVFPSRLESFGLVLIEAMAHGVIPIVSPLRGIFDSIISHGHDGFIASSFDNPLTYVEEIIRLIADRALMQNVSRNARETARFRFSIERMKENYTNLLQELCQKK